MRIYNVKQSLIHFLTAIAQTARRLGPALLVAAGLCGVALPVLASDVGMAEHACCVTPSSLSNDDCCAATPLPAAGVNIEPVRRARPAGDGHGPAILASASSLARSRFLAEEAVAGAGVPPRQLIGSLIYLQTARLRL